MNAEFWNVGAYAFVTHKSAPNFLKKLAFFILLYISSTVYLFGHDSIKMINYAYINSRVIRIRMNMPLNIGKSGPHFKN